MTPARISPKTQRLTALGLIWAVLALGAADAASAAAPALPRGWSHAQINVMIGHRAHTLIYDRGTVVGLGTSSLLLKERDGSVVSVPIAARASIVLDGRPVRFKALRRGETAQTMRVDGAPATQVQAQRREAPA